MRSPNHDARPGAPDMVVIHYTDMADCDAAIRWLCDPCSRVSAHYLITAGGDVVAMVDEDRRAWHAGVSYWGGTHQVNGRSIGIELDNPGHRPHAPVFAAAQIDALVRLLDGIRRRWAIPRRNVVGHSDVAPERKIDPGERFPWATLAAAGHALALPALPPPVPYEPGALAEALSRCGYDGSGLRQEVVDAFHRRHLPARVGSAPDGATLAAAQAVAALTQADDAVLPGARWSG